MSTQSPPNTQIPRPPFASASAVRIRVRRRIHKAVSTYPQTFLPSGSLAILVFPYQTLWQYFDRDPLMRAPKAGGLKKSRFLTGISFNSKMIQDRAKFTVEGR